MWLTFAPKLALVALLLSLAPLMSADPVQFQSGATQTSLLELYTSEGCSSCPPAEAWLSRLKDSPKLWKDFVPVAFHVDYWDYRLAIVAWVTMSRSLQPLQAVGGWLSSTNRVQ